MPHVYNFWGDCVDKCPPHVANNEYMALLKRLLISRGFDVGLVLMNYKWDDGTRYAPITDVDSAHEGRRELPVCIALEWRPLPASAF